MINTTGPDGTRVALLASNPARDRAPSVPEHAHHIDDVPGLSSVLADHDARLSALEGPAPAEPQGEESS
jgi:hypothetical protein